MTAKEEEEEEEAGSQSNLGLALVACMLVVAQI